MTLYRITLINKIYRLSWRFVWFFLASWTPVYFNKWRLFILNIFGAKVSYKSIVYSNVKIWSPKNLSIGDYSCLGPKVDFYNVAPVTIGKYSTISQRTFVCTASHDYNQAIIDDNLMDLIIGPISINDYCWVAAEAFIGPDITIDYGAVVLARSVVTKNLERMSVYAGNPSRLVKKRDTNIKQ